MDTTDTDKGPVQDFNTVYAMYYVSFVVVFSFFFLNIFVALIILTFQDLGEKEISNCELDRNQVCQNYTNIGKFFFKLLCLLGTWYKRVASDVEKFFFVCS
jgi:voltage-dependent calcium channel L type alpha-1D